VRPSEVAAWVQSVAGEVLAKRARVIAALERVPSDEPTSVSTSGLAAPAFAREPPRARGKATWVVAALAAIGVLALVTLVARHEAEPEAALPAIAWIAPGLTTPDSLASQDPPIASTPPIVASATPAPRGASPPKTQAKAPAARLPRGSSCDPPYSIDATGRKLFKPECMQ
jgi:hypothetical protein